MCKFTVSQEVLLSSIRSSVSGVSTTLNRQYSLRQIKLWVKGILTYLSRAAQNDLLHHSKRYNLINTQMD
jgi:hypothetical protein